MYGMPLEPSRKIVISQEINEQLAKEIVEQIMEVNEFDDQREEALVNYEREPIQMFINSGGGSATDGFAIIGAMEMSNTPIITYGLGIVASMALGIFVKGDFRIAHRYVRMMYHSVAYGAVGYIKDHEDAQKESDILQRMYNDLFLGTGITKAMMKDIREKKENFFFSGKEAVDLKIADKVLLKPEKDFKLLTPEEFEALQEQAEQE